MFCVCVRYGQIFKSRQNHNKVWCIPFKTTVNILGLIENVVVVNLSKVWKSLRIYRIEFNLLTRTSLCILNGLWLIL